MGIITEEFIDHSELIYKILRPGELEIFTTKDENGKNKPELFHIYNRRTFNEMLAECSEEKIIDWLNSLLSSSSSKLIGVFSMSLKIIKLDQPIGCAKINLPNWLINSHYIQSLNNVENNLCFFACIALAENVRRDRFKKRCKEIFYHFYGEKTTKEVLESYEGVVYIENTGCISKDDIYKYELMDKRFAINVYRLDESGFSCVLRKSPFNPIDLEQRLPYERKPIFLNLYMNHFSYIGDVNQILGYRCRICKRSIKTRQHLDEHERTCTITIKHTFNKNPQLYVKPRNKIVELCDWYDIELLQSSGPSTGVNNLFIYDYLICFDLEAINRLDKDGQIYQIPLSYSAVSNVPEYNQVEFFIGTNPREIVNNLFIFFNKVQIKAKELMMEKLKPLIDLIKNNFDKNNLKVIEKYCSQIPILGFNSSSYDINLMMDYGFIENILENKDCKSLSEAVKVQQISNLGKEDDVEAKCFIVKSGKRYKGIDTNKYLFRDVMLYCAAGTTLDKFLKCYNKDPNDHKFEFGIYRWLDDYEKINYKIKDIPRTAFYDDFKKIEYTNDQYNNFQNECEKHDLITVYDLLKYYNNQDVVPFLKACLEYKEFFYSLQLFDNKIIKMDMFKDGFTLPGLAAKIMNQFALPDEMYKFKLPPPSEDLVHPPTNIESKIEQYFQQDRKRIHRELEKAKSEKDCKSLSEAVKHQNYLKIALQHVSKISLQQVLDLLQEYNYKCLYCHTNLNSNSWSLDRKDNNQNHTKDNCVISCINCNKAKSNKPFLQFYQESYTPIPRFTRYLFYTFSLLHGFPNKFYFCFYRTLLNATVFEHVRCVHISR